MAAVGVIDAVVPGVRNVVVVVENFSLEAVGVGHTDAVCAVVVEALEVGGYGPLPEVGVSWKVSGDVSNKGLGVVGRAPLIQQRHSWGGGWGDNDWEGRGRWRQVLSDSQRRVPLAPKDTLNLSPGSLASHWPDYLRLCPTGQPQRQINYVLLVSHHSDDLSSYLHWQAAPGPDTDGHGTNAPLTQARPDLSPARQQSPQ
eukprot:873942-Rhodomonas_salina.2